MLVFKTFFSLDKNQSALLPKPYSYRLKGSQGIKHSSLFVNGISDDEKSFIRLYM
jgi:hypothetical protein